MPFQSASHAIALPKEEGGGIHNSQAVAHRKLHVITEKQFKIPHKQCRRNTPRPLVVSTILKPKFRFKIYKQLGGAAMPPASPSISFPLAFEMHVA
jgi:hypothetical protein